MQIADFFSFSFIRTCTKVSHHDGLLDLLLIVYAYSPRLLIVDV